MISKDAENRIRIKLSEKNVPARRADKDSSEMVKVFRGDKGLPGRGIKLFEQISENAVKVLFTDESESVLLLPKGKDGDSIQGNPGKPGKPGKNGKPGRGIASITQPTEDTMKIEFTDGTTVTLELPRGRDGREIELRATATHLQWRYVGEKQWKNLIALSLLTGMGEGAGSFKIVSTINGQSGNITLSAGANVSIVQNGNDFEISATGGSGGGDVTGPAGATANAIAIYNGTTGKIIKNSGATIDGSGNITATNFSGASSGTNTGDQDLSPYALISSLAAVAFSGDYGDLINLPTLVTDHGALTGLLDDDHPQYHTDARALTWLGTRSTSDLPEGSNLYFTDERAQDAVGLMVTDGSLVYVDGTPLLTRGALSGDISSPQGSNTTTLATVNANVGSFGDGTNVASFTVNAKGLITAAANVPISITSGAITDFVEAAQDATGAMVTDGTLVYVDATPLLTRGAISGDITIAQGSNTAAITAGVIVNADVNASAAIAYSKLANGSAASVMGTAGLAAPPASIASSLDGQVLRRSGTSIGWGAVDLASSNAVTGRLQLANIAAGIARSVLGVAGNASASHADIQGTADQVLVQNSAGNGMGWGQVNLAAAAAVTGLLPIANVAAGFIKADGSTVLSATIPFAGGTNAQFSLAADGTATAGSLLWLDLRSGGSSYGTLSMVSTFVGFQSSNGLFLSQTGTNYILMAGGAISYVSGTSHTFSNAPVVINAGLVVQTVSFTITNVDLVLAAGTGTKFATATNQKLAFWNKTPIIQPTTGITGATRVGGGGTTITDTDTFGGYTIAQLAAVIINTGLAA